MNNEGKIVAVQFKNKHGEGFGGRTYNYNTVVPVEVGQILQVNTKNGKGEVKVINTDVDPLDIPANIRIILRTITEENVLKDADGNPLVDRQQTFF